MRRFNRVRGVILQTIIRCRRRCCGALPDKGLLSPFCQTSNVRYGSKADIQRYPSLQRQRCDLFIPDGSEQWFIEVKMMRLMGDNGKKNDNILMHILSPYPKDRSALTDCDKLLESGFGGHKAVLIYGYDYAGWPLETAMAAFEILAESRTQLGPRSFAAFSGLVHPVHQCGGVYAWEVLGPAA